MGARILIAEDMPHIAHLLAHTLKKAGYETHVVHDGAEVLRAVVEFEPAAILLDMRLPNKSGLEICNELREDPDQKDLVIVIVTGHSFDDASVHEVEEADAHWKFAKPVGPVSLMAKLRELGVGA